MKYLSKKYGEKEAVFSRRKLLLLLGMVNENYRRIKKQELIKLSNNVVTESDIDDFYLRSNSKLNRILTTALDSLAKRKLIDYEERTIICRKTGSYYTHTMANKDEREKLLAIEYETLQEFNCSEMRFIALKGLSQQYYDRIKEIVKREYGWEYYYKAYSIVFNHDNICKSIPRIERTLDEAISELNSNIVDALNQEAETTYNRRLKNYNDLLEELEYNPAVWFKLDYVKKPHDNYIIAQKLLADELINISKEDPIDATFDITLIQANIDDDIESSELFDNNVSITEKI